VLSDMCMQRQSGRRASTRMGSVAFRCASLPSVSIMIATLNLHTQASVGSGCAGMRRNRGAERTRRRTL
jgi:hypothetical protein